LPFGFAEEAASAFGDATVSHSGGEDALLGCLLDAVHREMTKFEMVAHQEFFSLDFDGLGWGDLLLGLRSGEVTTDGMLGGPMSLGASRDGGLIVRVFGVTVDWCCVAHSMGSN
jgi:hypothetical protein